jgi:hypothetical protein
MLEFRAHEDENGNLNIFARSVVSGLAPSDWLTVGRVPFEFRYSGRSTRTTAEALGLTELTDAEVSKLGAELAWPRR